MFSQLFPDSRASIFYRIQMGTHQHVGALKEATVSKLQRSPLPKRLINF